jgi:hypothetical protein
MYTLVFPVLGLIPGFVVDVVVIIENRTACQRQADQNNEGDFCYCFGQKFQLVLAYLLSASGI